MTRFSIRSGGQTGVDRAALDAAVAQSIAYSGWCPLGGWAEDMPHPPGLLLRYSQLSPTPSPRPEQRTAWNVRDSDATLLVVRDDTISSPGTLFARTCAELVFAKPIYIANDGLANAIEPSFEWARQAIEQHATGFVLNVAGPRESEAPGVYEEARTFLNALFERLRVIVKSE